MLIMVRTKALFTIFRLWLSDSTTDSTDLSCNMHGLTPRAGVSHHMSNGIITLLTNLCLGRQTCLPLETAQIQRFYVLNLEKYPHLCILNKSMNYLTGFMFHN